MTSTNFMKYFAEETGLSQAKAKEILSYLDKSIKSYLSQMQVGETVKVADITYKLIDVPERSGVSAFNGEAWVSPAHKTVKVTATKAMKDIVR